MGRGIGYGTGILSAMVTRLGFADVQHSNDGNVETVMHRRFGLTIRERRRVPDPPEDTLLPEANGSVDPPMQAPDPAAISDHDLANLLRGVSLEAHASAPTAPESPGQELVEPPPLPKVSPARHAILTGKTIGVVGFTLEQAAGIGQAIAAQHCSFLTLTHTDAEFKKGAVTPCDLLLIAVRSEWVAPGSLEVSGLIKSKKPTIFVGPRDCLSHLALQARFGARDYLPEPFQTDELLWRAALLLGSLPAPKPRKGSKQSIKRVIVADEDAAARSLLHAVLSQEGIECHAAETGVAALQLIRAKQADALLIDVNVRGLDGFQVLAEIRRDPALSQVRVMLLTTRQAEVDVLRGFGLGADDYVTKPFSPLEVVARLKRSLARV